ncbi:UDP-3-O-(3-hydroxymyristoyl)glucosamine N-acyltransferase [bacterium]|nr:UDP-3-O-(3-hydroxymyristoyl)glucosamine N-acyltransferase [bacterium]
MPTTAFLNKLAGGELLGDGSLEIVSPSSFAEAGGSELTFYEGKDAQALAASIAGCVITSLSPTSFRARSLIVVANVRLGWAKALQAFAEKRDEEAERTLAFISKSARVDPSATILPFTYIGPFASVGADCTIGPNATIHKRCIVGRNVSIGAGSVVGSEGFGYAADEQGNHFHIPQLGTVVIEDDVEIAAGVTIDRAAIGETRIGKGTKIDNLVHIAHNVKVGKRCIITGQCGIAGSSVLEDDVILAGQVGVKDHVRIGKGAVVLAKSAVFKDIEPGACVSGIPARPHRLTMRAQARLLRSVSER